MSRLRLQDHDLPLRTESLEEPQLNLTPMIDIVFLLIIFFMVGTRFSEIEQKFDVDLPTAAPVKPRSSLPDPLIVNVARSGDIMLDGTELTANELMTRLKQAKENWKDQGVIIRGDGEGRYQAVVDVINMCHLTGLKFSLAYDPQGAPDGGAP